MTQKTLNRQSLYHSWQKIPCCRAFNQLNAGVLITVEGQIQFANQQICLYLQQKATSLYAHHFETIFQHNPHLLNDFKHAQEELYACNCCYMMTQKAIFPHTPHHRLFKIMAFWIHPQHQEAGICWIFQDTTNLIEKEELIHYEATSLRLFELLRETHQTEPDEQYIFHQLLREIVQQYRLKTVLYFKKEENNLVNTYAVDEDENFPYQFNRIPFDETITESVAYQALHQRKPIGSANITNNPFYQKYLKQTSELHLPVATQAFPVIIHNQIEGVISFYSYDTNFFSKPVVRQMKRLINEVCLYIQTNRVRQKNAHAVQALQTRLKNQVKTLKENKRVMQKQLIDINKMVSDLVLARNQAEAATRSKMNFLANVSHELRTPLNAVLGFAQMMAAETYGPIAQPEYREYVSFIQKSANHLLTLINDILDLSRSESGKMTLSETTVSLRQVLQESVDLIQQYPGAGERKITLHLSSDIFIRGDERMLKQIALNILSNAVKFTGKGGKIDVFAKSDQTGLTLIFTDNGIGIPANKIDSLFQPFAQIENVLTRSHQGSGLGLVLVKKMVILHEGTVRLESEEGNGTRLIIHFPPERLIQK